MKNVLIALRYAWRDAEEARTRRLEEEGSGSTAAGVAAAAEAAEAAAASSAALALTSVARDGGLGGSAWSSLWR